MEVAQLLRILRDRWSLVAASVIAGLAIAGVLAAVTAPTYEARTQLLVASAGNAKENAPVTPDEAYQAGLLAQQRATSYAALISSPRFTGLVAEEVGRPDDAAQLRGQLSASVPAETVLIDVAVRADSAERAKEIADAVDVRMPLYVAELETSGGSSNAAVQIRVASEAQLPTGKVSPKLPVYLAIGLVLGATVGTLLALARGPRRARVRA